LSKQQTKNAIHPCDGQKNQNNKQKVPSIHVMAQKHQNNKQNVHFMGLLSKRNI